MLCQDAPGYPLSLKVFTSKDKGENKFEVLDFCRFTMVRSLNKHKRNLGIPQQCTLQWFREKAARSCVGCFRRAF